MKSFNTIKTSALLAILCASISVFFIKSTTSIGIKELSLIGIYIFITTIITSAILIYYFTQRRIDGVYKMMDSLNKSGTSSPVKNDLFYEVESDVIDWASKRQEEIDQLKQTEEFRKEFIGNLAHELKTPLFSVQGYVLTLLEGGLEDESINRKFLLKASKGIDRIATVIEDMDTITRIESGMLELDKTRFDITGLVKNVFFELEEKAKEKGRTLTIDNSGKSAVFVSADRSKITQVVYNLITNSIYYGNQHGKTTVRINPIKDAIKIQIEDDGPGIEKEHLARLFERFYRVEKSRVRNKGGSGIGLAIVKHVIDAHGETITVESSIGNGTLFSFKLPKA